MWMQASFLTILAGLGVTCFLIPACGRSSSETLPQAVNESSPEGKLLLTLPRAREADEAVAVRITVGTMAKGARIIVKTAEGEVVGAVAPFGVLPGRKAGSFMVPVPVAAVKDGKVSLQLEVEESTAGKTRAPTKAEVEATNLELMPVSGTPE
jgi:hypothetical protein